MKPTLKVQGYCNEMTRYVVNLIFVELGGRQIATEQEESLSDTGPLIFVGPLGLRAVTGTSAARAEITYRLLSDHITTNRAKLRGLRGHRLIDICAHDKERLDREALTAIFHIVSGEDEVLSPVRDAHSRFPASASILVRLGVLDLPVVDLLGEYLLDRLYELSTGPTPPRSTASAVRVRVSHDLDAPFKLAFKSLQNLPQLIGSDIVRRNEWSSMWRTPYLWWCVRQGMLENDPFNCFARILAGHASARRQADFYFIAGNTAGRIDGDYKLADAPISKLMRDILEAGHRIGLHPSYHASNRKGALEDERENLSHALVTAGSGCVPKTVRTHYLRFDPIRTPALLAESGFIEDSSLAFADRAGFRRGTCRPFPLWDHQNSRALQLIEQPLVAMETTLLASRYEGLTHEEAAVRIDSLRDECQRHNGTFSLLWHNNYFESERDYALYEHALR